MSLKVKLVFKHVNTYSLNYLHQIKLKLVIFDSGSKSDKGPKERKTENDEVTHSTKKNLGGSNTTKSNMVVEMRLVVV